jgi:hypothetical protein
VSGDHRVGQRGHGAGDDEVDEVGRSEFSVLTRARLSAAASSRHRRSSCERIRSCRRMAEGRITQYQSAEPTNTWSGQFTKRT